MPIAAVKRSILLLKMTFNLHLNKFERWAKQSLRLPSSHTIWLFLSGEYELWSTVYDHVQWKSNTGKYCWPARKYQGFSLRIQSQFWPIFFNVSLSYELSTYVCLFLLIAHGSLTKLPTMHLTLPLRQLYSYFIFLITFVIFVLCSPHIYEAMGWTLMLLILCFFFFMYLNGGFYKAIKMGSLLLRCS